MSRRYRDHRNQTVKRRYLRRIQCNVVLFVDASKFNMGVERDRFYNDGCVMKVNIRVHIALCCGPSYRGTFSGSSYTSFQLASTLLSTSYPYCDRDVLAKNIPGMFHILPQCTGGGWNTFFLDTRTANN